MPRPLTPAEPVHVRRRRIAALERMHKARFRAEAAWSEMDAEAAEVMGIDLGLSGGGAADSDSLREGDDADVPLRLSDLQPERSVRFATRDGSRRVGGGRRSAPLLPRHYGETARLRASLRRVVDHHSGSRGRDVTAEVGALTRASNRSLARTQSRSRRLVRAASSRR